jgi:hypothetical protein
VKKFRISYGSFALAAALLFAAGSAALSLDTYTSEAGSYSVVFPSPSQENIQTTPAYHIVVHVLREDNVIYVAGHSDYAEALDPELELNANIDNYVKQISARILSRGTLAIARGDKPLLAKQFTYESDQLIGRGIVVVEGKTSYIAAASAVKPNGREVAVNAFVNSFVLVPAK